MQGFIENNKGSISIFLVLMILPMFLLAGLTIDGSRIVASKSMIADSGELAINAALSEYDDVLKDVYGLFGMSKTTVELEENLREYFSNSLSGDGGEYSGGNKVLSKQSFSRFVDMRVNEFKIEELKGSELTSPDILEKQIQEFMKYRGILGAVNNFQSKMLGLGDLDQQSKAITAKVDFDTELNQLQDALKKASENTKIYVNGPISNYSIENPTISLSDDITAAIKVSKEKFTEGTKRHLAAISFLAELKETSSKKSPLKPLEDIEIDLASILDDPKSETSRVISLIRNAKVRNFNEIVSYLVNLKKGTKILNEVYLDILVYEKSYKEYLASNKSELTETEINSLEIIHQQRIDSKKEIKKFYDDGVALRTKLNLEAADFFINGKSEIANWDLFLTSRIVEIQNAIDSLGIVLDRIKQITTEKNRYKNQVIELEQSDLKSSFLIDFQNNAEKIDSSQVQKMISVLEKNKDVLNQFSKDLNQSIYLNEKILEVDVNVLISKIKLSQINSLNELIVDSQKLVEKNFKFQSPSSTSRIMQIDEKIPFYLYLLKVTQSRSSDLSKKDAMSKKDALFNQASFNASPAADSNPSGLTISSLLPADFISKNPVENTFSTHDLSNESSDSVLVKNQKNMLQDLSQIVSTVSSLPEVAINKLLLEEYITEMFSCYSNKENQLNLNSYALNSKNNVLFKNEVEYILWGNNVVEKNVTNTMNLLFGMRFLLNCSYAFSSTEISAITNSLAAAIAGWTVFAVPLVQTTLTLAFALAESKLDIEDLKNGLSVPILKNSGNWKCGLSGLKNIAIQETQEFAEQRITDVFDTINNFSNEKTDELTGSIDNYAKSRIQSAVDSAKGTIINPIRAKTINLVSNSIALSDEEIAKQIDDVLLDIRKEISKDQDGALKQSKLQVLDFVESNFKTALVLQIVEMKSNFETNNQFMDDSVFNMIFEQINQSIMSQLSSRLSTVGDNLKNEIEKVLVSKENDLKEIILGKIDSFSSQFDNVLPKDTSTSQTGIQVRSSSMALTYKEYLKLFITLGLLDESNKNEMLKRVANLVQINISRGKQSADNGKEFIKNPNFNLSNKFSFLKIEANIGVKTNFMKVPFQNGSSKKNYNLTSNKEQFQMLSFKTIGGY